MTGLCEPIPRCPPPQMVCGDKCIDPSTETCQSGIPTPNAPQRKKRDLSCQRGTEKCPIGGGKWECVDTSKDIESCE